jgi:hypothetical protein
MFYHCVLDARLNTEVFPFPETQCCVNYISFNGLGDGRI